MALSGIMIERGRPEWWGQSTDHTDLPLHGDIFLTWSNAYWWGHYMTQHSHPCIIHGETCSDSIVDRCSTLNRNMFNPIFVKILTQTSKHSPPQHKKALAQSSWAPSVCARVFENFQTLDLRMFWMLPVHTTISLLVTTHSSDSGFMDEAINNIPVFFWLSPVLCVWISAASVTFFSKMLPKTNRGCTKPTFQFVLQLYFSCYRHIQTQLSFALEPKVF